MATTHEPDAEELLGQLLDLHGEGLVRILDALAAAPAIRDEVVADPVVASMLLVHDLHPVPLEERVLGALERVRPYLASHGGDVELLGVEGGVARLRLQGSCKGCAASASTLELAIERALEEDAPDLEEIEVEGVVDQPRAPAKALPLLGSSPQPAWTPLEVLPEPGELASVPSGLLVANVAGTLLAYRDRCAGCGSSLHEGVFEAGVLVCPGCNRQFALTLAGRAIGAEELQLDPVPLLEVDGRPSVTAVAPPHRDVSASTCVPMWKSSE
jgi:Fe-S cluster biogenesis protein NfuA/nitrite reductase/ring-hydroxylating ferredoxin subunit